MTEQLTTISEIEEAAARTKGVALTTPLLPSQTFSRMSDSDLWLKAENLQRTGSFKIRGATNALAQLSEEQRRRGVVTASAGNHAQGVALAAGTLGVPATVFMPEWAALPKIDSTRGYGAEVQLGGATVAEALDASIAFAASTGARLIHPYDDRHIIAGQGTLALELLEQLPEPGTLVVPVGGGGLIAGVATAVKARRPETRVVGVQAAAMAPYVASRKAGRPVEVEARFTVADGIAVERPSALVFAHIESYVDDLVTVEDAEITQAVALLLERAKFLVEPAGAVPLAAALAGLIPDYPEPVVAILSGGNIDLLFLDRVVRHGLEAAGRFASFRVRVPDVPGQLAKVAGTIAAHQANIVAVEHHREGIGLPFGFTEIWFSIETRSSEQLERIITALGDLDVRIDRATAADR